MPARVRAGDAKAALCDTAGLVAGPVPTQQRIGYRLVWSRLIRIAIGIGAHHARCSGRSLTLSISCGAECSPLLALARPELRHLSKPWP